MQAAEFGVEIGNCIIIIGKLHRKKIIYVVMPWQIKCVA
jgi:hypothetical protein